MDGVQISLRIINLLFYNLMPLPAGRGFFVSGGVVFVRFVVEPDGSIDEVTVIRGVSEALDREAIRLIKEMPQWNPGLQKGRAVRVYYTIPIRFELR